MQSPVHDENVWIPLTLKNVRLPPEAYRSLEHVTPSEDPKDLLPLVDIEYVYHQPSSASCSGNAVEVYVAASDHTNVEPPFDRFKPFDSTCQDLVCQPAPSHEVAKQLVARFSAATPTKVGMIPEAIDARGSLALPGALCHPHIHLDKCYLLDRCTLSTGTFDEALASTAEAKANFTGCDVMARMRRLISSSISHGVTSMRAFVEVDPTVGTMCLDVALQLKTAFRGSCEVQVAAFAQDPIFYPDDMAKQEQMHSLLRQAASISEVDVIGSAPYVETLSTSDQRESGEKERKQKQKAQQKKNIDFVFDLAQEFGKHVDFHLDYDLAPPGREEDGEQAMIPYVLSLSQTRLWTLPNGKQRSVTLGHCTKLSSFSEDDIAQLATTLSASHADGAHPLPPVSFVSLPPSDLYMQGRAQAYSTRPRATMPLLDLGSNPMLAGKLNWAMGVNNVANLFTPQGDADPLALLPMMVGVWQSAKPKDCETLLSAVSCAARAAAGLTSSYESALPDQSQGGETGGGGEVGEKNLWADLVVLDGSTSVQAAVCAPGYSRITIKDGRLVARRKVASVVYPLLVKPTVVEEQAVSG